MTANYLREGLRTITATKFFKHKQPPKFCLQSCISLRQWFPTVGNPGILGLQLCTAASEGFWELQSKNTWIIQG